MPRREHRVASFGTSGEPLIATMSVPEGGRDGRLLALGDRTRLPLEQTKVTAPTRRRATERVPNTARASSRSPSSCSRSSSSGSFCFSRSPPAAAPSSARSGIQKRQRQGERETAEAEGTRLRPIARPSLPVLRPSRPPRRATCAHSTSSSERSSCPRFSDSRLRCSRGAGVSRSSILPHTLLSLAIPHPSQSTNAALPLANEPRSL